MKLLKLSKARLSELYTRAYEKRNNPTPAELQAWVLLRRLQPKYIFRRQIVPHGTAFIVDFFCKELNLAVEIDGEYHNAFTIQQKDEERTNMLNRWGIKVMRFTNQTVFEEPDHMFKEVQRMCDILHKKWYGVKDNPPTIKETGIQRINRFKREGKQKLKDRLFGFSVVNEL